MENLYCSKRSQIIFDNVHFTPPYFYSAETSIYTNGYPRTFNNFSFTIGLAGFNEVGAGGVEFEAVRLVSVTRLAHSNILQRDNPPRLLVRRVLEVIKTVVVQDEPAPLPALVTAPC